MRLEKYLDVLVDLEKKFAVEANKFNPFENKIERPVIKYINEVWINIGCIPRLDHDIVKSGNLYY
ncbi:hypothetical protein F0310_05000 (plasmid) [Borrelia sp. A-FGy1]|nr:hypothetical protein F0310_05000 [Borrelia sp. A-FGy1]